MTTFQKNYGQIKAMHVGYEPPINIVMLWYDTNNGVKKIKYYDTVTLTWKVLGEVGGTGDLGDYIPITGTQPSKKISGDLLVDSSSNIKFGIFETVPQIYFGVGSTSNIGMYYSISGVNKSKVELNGTVANIYGETRVEFYAGGNLFQLNSGTGLSRLDVGSGTIQISSSETSFVGEVVNVNSNGFLIPRIGTSQRYSTDGSIAYNSQTYQYEGYRNGVWKNFLMEGDVDLSQKLDLDGSNANQDIDIGNYSLNAKHFKVNGTNGSGHIGLKHQSSAISASASESSFAADVNGNPIWKNDGNVLQYFELTSNKNVNNGYAGLDSTGKLNTSVLPDLAVVDYLGSVVNQSAMLGLTGQKGDWCIRSDRGTTFIITGSNTSLIGSWTELAYPAATVADVVGTLNRVTVSGGTTKTIDIASTYVGQTSITTLGTIGTGVWQGTSIADAYIASASTWNGKFNTPTGLTTNYVSKWNGSGYVDSQLIDNGSSIATVNGNIYFGTSAGNTGGNTYYFKDFNTTSKPIFRVDANNVSAPTFAVSYDYTNSRSSFVFGQVHGVDFLNNANRVMVRLGGSFATNLFVQADEVTGLRAFGVYHAVSDTYVQEVSSLGIITSRSKSILSTNGGIIHRFESKNSTRAIMYNGGLAIGVSSEINASACLDLQDTNKGLGLNLVAGNLGTTRNGLIWHDVTANLFKGVQNNSVVTFATTLNTNLTVQFGWKYTYTANTSLFQMLNDTGSTKWIAVDACSIYALTLNFGTAPTLNYKVFYNKNGLGWEAFHTTDIAANTLDVSIKPTSAITLAPNDTIQFRLNQGADGVSMNVIIKS